MINKYYFTNYPHFLRNQNFIQRNFGALNYFDIKRGTNSNCGELSTNLSEKLSAKLSICVKHNPSIINLLPKRCPLCKPCEKIELGTISSAIMKVHKKSDCLIYSIINGYNVNYEITEFISICPVGEFTKLSYKFSHQLK